MKQEKKKWNKLIAELITRTKSISNHRLVNYLKRIKKREQATVIDYIRVVCILKSQSEMNIKRLGLSNIDELVSFLLSEIDSIICMVDRLDERITEIRTRNDISELFRKIKPH